MSYQVLIKNKKGESKPVKDATRPFTFKVTAHDVSIAKTKEPMSCAVAQGAMHAGHALAAKIGRTVAFIERKRYWERYNIQNEDRLRITAFDHSGYFQPGTYTLVPPFVKTGRSHKRKSGPSGGHVKNKPTRTIPIRQVVVPPTLKKK